MAFSKTIARFNRVASVSIAACIVLLAPNIARAQYGVTADDVDNAIQRGREAILAKIKKEDVITYQNPGGPVQTVTGKVTRRRGGVVMIDDSDGKQQRIPERFITKWERSGFVTEEMEYIHFGGPTALACLALLTSDLELSEPGLERCLRAMAMHPLPEAGTYVHSLRASIWSHMLLHRRLDIEGRRTYKRLLDQDMTWLEKEMHPDGGFDYGYDLGGGDSSNTQFAHLGFWRGNLAGAEISRDQWKKIEQYWAESQSPSGGWSYVRGDRDTSSSMTVAGCNSLYIVLDRLHAKGDRAYQIYRGCVPNAVVRKDIAKIYKLIDAADTYLQLHPVDPAASEGYELFGIERLGLASGRAVIGGLDWYRSNVGSLVNHKWGKSLIADCFTLIFLVHGQAPVLFQKLEYGEDPDAWNYYFRDLHGLTNYLNGTFERLHRWQYIPSDADLTSLKHAPFLLISGHDKFSLSSDTRNRLTEYIESGGMLIFHADQRNRKFAESAREEIKAILHATPWPIRELTKDHPLFKCHYDLSEKRIPAIEASSDGPRILAMLFPFDMAGAWHQEKTQFEVVFQLMANLRMYHAAPYSQLPRVLPRRDEHISTATLIGDLTIRRFAYEGDWRGHYRLWERNAERLQQMFGVRISSPRTKRKDGLDELKKSDIVHIPIRSDARFDDDDIAMLIEYVNSGGTVLIESTDGQEAGNGKVLDLVKRLDVGKRDILAESHPLATGGFPSGHPLRGLRTSADGAALLTGASIPPILIRTIDQRVGVIACPFDLSAGLDRHHIWRRIGFDGPSTDKIVGNILAFCVHQKNTAAETRSP